MRYELSGSAMAGILSHMFGRQAKRLEIPERTRVMVIAGGSGHLGRIVLAEVPGDVLVVNVSKTRQAHGDRVVNCHFDLLRHPERAFAHLKALLPRVDVFVYAAYSPTFTSFGDIERKRFLREYELNVFTAVECVRLCGAFFWQGREAENQKRARKAVFISSAAAFGKTTRPELASYSATKAAVNALGPYAHDYLYDRYGVSAHVLAPGSLQDKVTREAFTGRFWQLEREAAPAFTLERLI